MPQKKQPKPETPPAAKTQQEIFDDWRRKRAARGSLEI